MSREILFIVILLFTFQASAQIGPSSPKSGVVFQRVPSGFVTQLPPAPIETSGNYYLEESWQTGKLYLTDNILLDELQFRYDIKNYVFEIRTSNDIKLLPGKRVQFFTEIDAQGIEHFYFNLRGYLVGGIPVNGFAKVISEGTTYRLISLTDVKETKGAYNVALDVGERNNVIQKQIRYFLVKNHDLIEMKKSKKKLIGDVFEFTGIDIRPIIDINKLSCKNERDFLVIVRSLN